MSHGLRTPRGNSFAGRAVSAPCGNRVKLGGMPGSEAGTTVKNGVGQIVIEIARPARPDSDSGAVPLVPPAAPRRADAAGRSAAIPKTRAGSSIPSARRPARRSSAPMDSSLVIGDLHLRSRIHVHKGATAQSRFVPAVGFGGKRTSAPNRHAARSTAGSDGAASAGYARPLLPST